MVRYNQELLNCVAEMARTNKAISEKLLFEKEFLLKQDQEVNHISIIKDGIAKCYITENNGKDYILEFLGIGEIVGEVEVLHSSKSITNVEAISKVSILRIEKKHFLEILKQNWSFNLLIMKELTTRVIQTARRASYQQSYPLEYSILKLIYLFSSQPLMLNKKDLADYLGITLRSLNRTLLILQQKDIIYSDNLDLKKSKHEIAQLLFQYERN